MRQITSTECADQKKMTTQLQPGSGLPSNSTHLLASVEITITGFLRLLGLMKIQVTDLLEKNSCKPV